MISPDAILVQAAPLVHEQPGEGGPLYVAALPTGPIVALDEVGQIVLEAFEGASPATVSTILADLAEEHGWPKDVVLGSVVDFLHGLVEVGILTEVEAAADQP